MMPFFSSVTTHAGAEAPSDRRLPGRLSWRLLGAILPFVVCAVSVIVWLQYAAARREILEAIGREIRFLSQRAARDIEDLLRQRRQDLLTLSETPLIADYYRNVEFGLLDEAESYRAELERFLLKFAQRTQVYPEILYLDSAGREQVRVLNGRVAPRRDLARSIYFSQARRLAPGGWWASGLQKHPGVGDALYFVKPVHDELGRLKGALALIYDATQFWDLLRGAEIGPRARARLRSPEGRFPSEVLADPPGDMLSGEARVRERPWTVAIQVPLDQALRPLRTVRNAAFATALLGLAALVAVIILSVRSITRPVARLVEATRRLGEGDLEHRIEEVGTDEIGALSAAFNEMAGRLETDRRKNEELQGQLIQAEKVAAAGLLLSSVAHELSNPLAVVAGHAQLLKYRDLPPQARGILDEIKANAMRCAQVVSNMLLFVRSSRDSRKPVRLDAVVESALKLLHYRLTKGDDVEVVVDVEPGLPEVAGDFQQLSQVVVNLISNARDAMEAVDSRQRKKRLELRVRASPERVTVEVRDNGPGVAPGLEERIFEPFVTTKEPGRGTGLGLYVCRQIAEAHLGTLTFETRPGEGATFRLRLPLGSPVSHREPAGDEPGPVTGKRILVVDDEPGVADVIARALAEEGDEVAVSTEGADAVSRLGRERFDLVVSDIEMQAVKGYEVYEAARGASGGGVPVLIVTGNSLDRRVHKFFESTGVPYVVKPFDTTYLRRAVRRLLAGQPITGLQTE